jgi:hypothetical protein
MALASCPARQGDQPGGGQLANDAPDPGGGQVVDASGQRPGHPQDLAVRAEMTCVPPSVSARAMPGQSAADP